MTFEEAKAAAKEGKRVHRKGTPRQVLKVGGGRTWINQEAWCSGRAITDEDKTATDWVTTP